MPQTQQTGAAVQFLSLVAHAWTGGSPSGDQVADHEAPSKNPVGQDHKGLGTEIPQPSSESLSSHILKFWATAMLEFGLAVVSH